MTKISDARALCTACGFAVALSAFLAPSASWAQALEVGPSDDVEAAINALGPGGELVLQGGMYTLTSRFGVTVAGTAAAPIVVRAKDGEVPHLNRPAADQNVIDLDSVEYLVIRGLEVSGGSHGIRMVSARFVTIENCDIHDTGDVALSANSGGDYEGLQILRNHIHHTNNTGEGMYLGCNSDGCRVFDSLIEGNYVHHTNGPTVVQGDGIELKEGSYNNVIRDNVIHDTNYPCILTYSTVGNGAPNIIERNVMWGCGDHGMQVAADAVIRNNIVLGAAASGIANQPHQAGTPSNLVIVHNTVLNDGDALRSSGITGTVLIANNALYSSGGTALGVAGDLTGVQVLANVGMGGLSGVSSGLLSTGDLATDFVAASFSGTVPNDVFPLPGSLLIGAGDAAHVAVDDFNGTLRMGIADAGAYKFDMAGNPGWALIAAPKSGVPSAGGAPGSDGGVTGGSAGAVGAGGATGGAPPSSGGQGASSGGQGAVGASGSGQGGGTSGTAGAPSSDAGANADDGSGDEGGCGCRAARAPATGSLAWIMFVLALAARVRRASRRIS